MVFAVTSVPAVVEVVDWTPVWGERFEQDKAELEPVLPADSTIEHIGSTSVSGLAAKPTIDILVVTAQVEALRADLRSLEALGYSYNPKYFADDKDHLYLMRDVDGRRTEHLHIFHSRSSAPESDRVFRDYLIAHRGAVQRYAEAKRAAARDHPDSRGAYGRAKETVFQQLLIEARTWAASRRT